MNEIPNCSVETSFSSRLSASSHCMQLVIPPPSIFCCFASLWFQNNYIGPIDTYKPILSQKCASFRSKLSLSYATTSMSYISMHNWSSVDAHLVDDKQHNNHSDGSNITCHTHFVFVHKMHSPVNDSIWSRCSFINGLGLYRPLYGSLNQLRRCVVSLLYTIIAEVYFWTVTDRR